MFMIPMPPTSSETLATLAWQRYPDNDPSQALAIDLFWRHGKYDFAARMMGLRESGRIVNPAGVPVLGFFRCHTLYHCFGLAHSPTDGLHHFQLTLKDSHQVIAAYEHMKARGKVELLWGPLRHGAGQNCAFYFKDAAGNIVEYSAEEELILDEDTYVPVAWSTTDTRPTDERNRTKAPWARH